MREQSNVAQGNYRWQRHCMSLLCAQIKMDLFGKLRLAHLRAMLVSARNETGTHCD